MTVVTHAQPVLRGGDAKEYRELHKPSKDRKSATATTRVVSNNHFSRVYHYANSRMPAHLPPLKLYASPFRSLVSFQTAIKGNKY